MDILLRHFVGVTWFRLFGVELVGFAIASGDLRDSGWCNILFVSNLLIGHSHLLPGDNGGLLGC